jgi:hypothetical protein
MLRIDTHHHSIPSFYRDLLRNTGMRHVTLLLNDR